MTSIQLDGLTISLTDSLDPYNMCNDSANVELLGDNTQVLTINVGHDSLRIRAHFITLVVYSLDAATVTRILNNEILLPWNCGIWDSGYDTTDWQNSAIDREVGK